MVFTVACFLLNITLRRPRPESPQLRHRVWERGRNAERLSQDDTRWGSLGDVDVGVHDAWVCTCVRAHVCEHRCGTCVSEGQMRQTLL